MKSTLPLLLLLALGGDLGPSGAAAAAGEDLYQLLGVARDADVKDIRRAFKKLAVKLHPDKNQDDEEAQEKFVKVARAYEILKDPDTRKHYDVHGDTGEESGQNRQYHSYTYYRDQFGIYDDDPLIVTLSKADYELNVLDTNQAWFVNFYSPNCHHCHELAPAWRRLAAEFEGALRVAAVNCEDDWALCYQLSVQSYPTLLFYEKAANLHEGEKYRRSRSFDHLKQFLLGKLALSARVLPVTRDDWTGFRREQWLLFLCPENDGGSGCPEEETRLKLAAILDGLMSVGIVTDEELCGKILDSYKTNPVVMWEVPKEGPQKEHETSATIHAISGSYTKDIVNELLNILPNPETLNEDKFREVRTELRDGSGKPWLICFYLGTATDLNLQLKRLPSLVPMVNIGLVHCGRSSALCSALHVPRYPAWGVVKVGGAFELHHGRDILHEVIAFARDSIRSTNLHALSPADFSSILNEGSTWFIDWYAPWCPPCKRLIPALRRASMHFESDKIQFGTVDCTQHRNLCSQQGITSYPTTRLYNRSQIHQFHGVPSENGIVEFVEDMMHPAVIHLDDSSFVQLMRKPKDELWIVDYFAPWCGPCTKLGPEWRQLAKQMTVFAEVKVAQVDCVAYEELCKSQNVKSYPTIRLYPLNSKGLNSVAIYNGNRDALSLKRWILDFLPSSITTMTSSTFKEQILTKNYLLPWLVDFYAPWCGHCVHLEPELRKVAQRLEGRVRTAKIDCEVERVFCATQHVNGYPAVFLYFSPNDRRPIQSRNYEGMMKEIKDLIASEKNKQDQRRQQQHGHDEL